MFKLERDNERLVKYEAWLVVKGFQQKDGIEFDEFFFFSYCEMSSNYLILGLVAKVDVKCDHSDVKQPFFTVTWRKRLMVQPEEFGRKRKVRVVCKLEKSLYGLKQAQDSGISSLTVLC